MATGGLKPSRFSYVILQSLITVYLFGLLIIHLNVNDNVNIYETGDTVESSTDGYLTNEQTKILTMHKSGNQIFKLHVNNSVIGSIMPGITIKTTIGQPHLNVNDKMKGINSTSAVKHDIHVHQKKTSQKGKAKNIIVSDLPKTKYQYMVQTMCQIEENNLIKRIESEKELCPCISEELKGNIAANMSRLLNYTWNDLEVMNSNLDLGGHWTPTVCAPRRRVVIIIPYRDREKHLVAFLAHTHPILQRQLIEYQILVVEQRFPMVFNKGSLMNAGYHMIKNVTAFRPDCVVFHDVDMLMLTDTNQVMCFDYPTHLGAYVDKFNFSLVYNGLFGGAVAISTTQFVEVNGFSNKFEGWGGEDDDFIGRIRRKLRRAYRGPEDTARYSMIKHSHDTTNPINAISRGDKDKKTAAKRAQMSYRKHGLNTVKFTVVSVQVHVTHTHIVVDFIR